MKKKIVITGGSGRFGSILKKKFIEEEIFFPSRKELLVDEIKISVQIKQDRIHMYTLKNYNQNSNLNNSHSELEFIVKNRVIYIHGLNKIRIKFPL